MKTAENGQNWFRITKLKDYLYVIEEMLYKIDPRFYTNNINIYLIIGTHSALLIDTGCGLFPLKPFIKDIIANKKLKVVNTHSHFDHIGGNSEFDTVYNHEEELNAISIPTDV
jgi:glyoxylase-like metal-dependent hydrolase (beta-lactamase superfamily II)